MNAVATIPPMPISDMQTLAVAIAKSALFGIRTPEQALVLMAIAQAEGRHPVEAARDYDVIQGRPAKKAEAMMRDFVQAGGKVEWHALTDTLADATFTHPQTGSVRIDWDLARANTAGLAGKDNWKKHPRQMLRSRVVSEGVRTLWPLATSGMYVPEEQADIPAKPEHNGPTLEAKAEEPVAAGLASEARQAINDAVPLKAAAAAMPRAARIAEKAPDYEAPEWTDEQWRRWLEKLRLSLSVLYNRSEVVDLANKPTIGNAISTGPDWVRRDISAALAEAYARFPEEGDEMAIEGEEKAAAG